jgi:TonB family protein
MNDLLDIVVRSSLMVAIGLFLMPLLGRKSAALRHWILFTCLMCAAAVPVVGRVLPSWGTATVSALVPLDAVDGLSPSQPAAPTPRQGSLAARTAPTTATDPMDWRFFFIVLWSTGAFLSFATLVIGFARLIQIDASAAPVSRGPWAAASRRGASVRVTPRPGLLLVWGVWRPSIIIPSTALTWSPERVSSVLRHELAHVTRGDWILQIASEVVRAMYWFNPLVWLTCARLRAECEIACDDVVIADGASGSEYAAHVVDIARELNTRYWVPAPAIVRPSTLERRVRAMLDKSRNRQIVSRRARSGATALLLAATVAVGTLAAQSFASLAGTIVDPSNGVLPGVKLVLVNEQTQMKYEIQTDGAGRYEFVGLPPGNYSMDAALPGFSRFAGRVTVSGQNLQQDVTMNVGEVQEQITVTAGPERGSPVVAVDPERARKIEEMRAKRAAACGSPQTPTGVQIGGNLRVPLKLRDVRPIYPAALQATAGTVVLKTKIASTGNISDVEVVSATHDEFAQSAIEAVKQWEFSATLLNCDPIDTPMKVTVNYKLAQ